MSIQRPIIDLGDYVNIKGYGDRMYKVFEISVMREVSAFGVVDDTYYEVVSCEHGGGDTAGGEFIYANHEDVLLVEKENAVNYDELKGYTEMSDESNEILYKSLDMSGYLSYGTDATEEDLTQGVSTEDIKDAIDKLLDEINDYKELINIVGDEDNEYSDIIKGLTFDIRDITRGRG